ncbi:hypothetical protein [Parasphingorhabdus pacifica]
MPVVSKHRPTARHRLLRFVGHEPPGRSPVVRRILAADSRRTAWLERKPGAMWDPVTTASRAALAR